VRSQFGNQEGWATWEGCVAGNVANVQGLQIETDPERMAEANTTLSVAAQVEFEYNV
jgi:hypothetical protein